MRAFCICLFAIGVCVLVAFLMFNCLAQDEKKEEGDRVKLLSVKKEGKMSLEEAIAKRRSRRDFTGDAISLEDVSQILWATQGISDEKRGLRTVPSAGATFPLEVYLVAGNVKDLKAGLYRYDYKKHELVLVKSGDIRKDVCAAALGQQMVQDAPATVVIAAVYERTSKRYGNRAERYVHMEVGHAGQNIYLQCEALGMGTCAVGAFQDAKLKNVLGINEEPLYLMPVGKTK